MAENTIPGAVPSPPAGVNKKSGWPIALGIISIILGIGGFFVSLFGIAMVFFSSRIAALAAGNESMAQMSFLHEKYGPYIVLMSAVMLALALVLVFAGISLLRRRRVSRKLMLGWAGAKVTAALVSTVVNIPMQRASLAFQREQIADGTASPQLEAAAKITEVTAVAGVVGGLLWALLFPVFIFIWLKRQKIKAEMDGWQ